MASWIKIECHIFDKLEVFQLANILDDTVYSVVGKCCKVWSWFDSNTTDGVTVIDTKLLLDHQVNTSGFCDAMVKVGWMEEDEKNIILPNYDRHNSQTAKDRALTSKRVSKLRKNVTPVTVDRYKNVTPVTDDRIHDRYIDKRREDKIREDIFISEKGENENNNILNYDGDRLTCNSKYPLIAIFYDAIRKYNNKYPIVTSNTGNTVAMLAQACEDNLRIVKELSKSDFQSIMEIQMSFGNNPVNFAQSPTPVKILNSIAINQIAYLKKQIASKPPEPPVKMWDGKTSIEIREGIGRG